MQRVHPRPPPPPLSLRSPVTAQVVRSRNAHLRRTARAPLREIGAVGQRAMNRLGGQDAAAKRVVDASVAARDEAPRRRGSPRRPPASTRTPRDASPQRPSPPHSQILVLQQSCTETRRPRSRGRRRVRGRACRGPRIRERAPNSDTALLTHMSRPCRPRTPHLLPPTGSRAGPEMLAPPRHALTLASTSPAVTLRRSNSAVPRPPPPCRRRIPPPLTSSRCASRAAPCPTPPPPP